MTEADDPTPAKRAIPALMRTAEVKVLSFIRN
jgi:hypothetical protein